ncbi:MAG: TonB-dependent receptor [Sphingobacterium sp.]|jgi:hypothetical protein|nr:TonB-dependent receptor [Sphingobacterium sp.]
MKPKLFYLLGMIGSLSFQAQQSFAASFLQESKVHIDTVGGKSQVTVQVKDWRSSKLLDSVRVTLGRESKYTNRGVVVFANNPDSVIVLDKPGYNRFGQRVKGANVSVKMLKKAETEFSVGVESTVQTPVALDYIRTITGDNLRNVSVLSPMDGLRVYLPALFVDRNPNYGDNPNILPSIYLRGMNAIPFSGAEANKNVRSGLQVNPSQGDYRAYQVMQPNSPVFLLDGVQVTAQTIQDMDINRIEAVSILDDALTTAAYGLKGGNGIISVRTKRPTGKFQLSLTEQLQLVTPVTQGINLLDAKQKLAVEKASGMFDDPVWSSVFERRYDKAYTGNINTNWPEVPIQKQLGSKHSLTLSAGNDDIVYGLNAGYNDIQGVMKGSGRKILDLGAYFSGRIGAVTFNNQFTYLGVNATNSPYGTYDAYQKMNPYWDPIDQATGKYQKIVESDTINGANVTFKNPAFNSTLSTTDKSSYTRFSNQTNLNWIIGSGFQVNGMFNIARQGDDSDYFLPPNHTLFADISADNLFKRGLYRKMSNSFLDAQGGARLQYQNSFNKHTITANLGQFISQTSSNSEAIEVAGFAVDRLADISFGNAYAIAKPVSGKIKTRQASSFANIVYDFDRRYQINVTGSLDYYSGTNHSALSSGVGFAWNLHNENFLKAQNWLNLLRVRGSIGTSGNQNYLSYLNRNTYNYYTDQQYIPTGGNLGTIGMGLGAYLTGIGNTNLKSPKVSKRDLSVEAAFLNRRLSFDVNVFQQISRDMVLPLPAGSTAGFNQYAYYANYGELESKGIQFGLQGTILDGKTGGLKLDLMANAFHGNDKIKSVGPYIEQLNALYDSQADQRQMQPRYAVGYSPSALWAVPSLGIDPQTGNEIFRKKDGSSSMVWDAADKVFVGNATANWSGALGMRMGYRAFTLASYFHYALGAYVYNYTLAGIENASIHENLDVRALSSSRWYPGRTDATDKALFQSPTYATTRFIEKENRLNCASISLGYQFLPQVFEKMRLTSLGVKLMVNNAFEVNSTNTIQRGIQYPQQRTYSFILNATF